MTEVLTAQAGPETNNLAMVAVYPRAEEADSLAVGEGLEVDDLHVTLVFLGDADELEEPDIHAAVSTAALASEALEGTVGGIGFFAENEDGIPVLALPDVPGLTRLREDVVSELNTQGIESPSEHGFLPHMTLTYADDVETPDQSALGQPLHFDSVSVVVADRRTDYPLGGAMTATADRPQVLYVNEEDLDKIQLRPLSAATTISVTVDDGEADTAAAAEAERVPWQGILAIEGKPTSDGRYLIPGEIGERELPLPLAPSHEAQHESETVGRIESIQHIPASEFDREGWELPDDLLPQAVVIWGEGSFDGSPAAEEALRALKNGVGVSLDLPIDRQALIDDSTFEEVDPRTLDEDDMLAMMFGLTPEGYLRGIAGKIGGLSLASIAAFEETTIRILDDHALVASGFGIKLFKAMIAGVGLTAAAPVVRSRSVYERPEADKSTPLTVTEEGEIFGHAFLWDTCHTGFADRCVTPAPSPSEYAYFHLGAVETLEGDEIAVGQITLDTGHADIRAGRNATRRHYDDTGVAAADVRMIDGKFGGWVSGTLRDVSEEDARKLKAAKLSGDWRSVNGRLDLIGLLAVNVPGFPVPRPEARLVASGEGEQICALVAAGIIDEDEEQLSLLVELLSDPDEMTFLVTELVGWEDEFAYSAEERRRMAKNGQAMKDGSFPIANCADAEKAIRSQGRASDQEAAVRHIKKRVRALDCAGQIFDDYK